MGVYKGDDNDNTFDLRGVPLGPGQTGNSVNLYGGNDTFYGSSYTDIVSGGTGDDLLYGLNGNDILIGDDGTDRLYDGNGTDNLTGGAGNDYLNGGAGNDVMYGGTGDDAYLHFANTGIDIVNDDKNEAASNGFGGGADTVYLGFNLNEIQYYRPAGTNNLAFGTTADLADGTLNDGVIVQDFYLGGNNRVEYLETADGYTVDLSFIV
ncbi:calcium-binding protein [Methylobacterium sp. Leaf125]|uniref:calcium-binding protein n=1 Tax=Methylobacterium sp. Leaf125 TaxID=1736265 RepID=UPI0009EC636A|nr:calcium-binding protein [Methylobacterium sp. Leaf125]